MPNTTEYTGDDREPVVLWNWNFFPYNVYFKIAPEIKLYMENNATSASSFSEYLTRK